MRESDRNRLKKKQLALLLAASDRDHAEAAARALEIEAYNVSLMRALETAIAVSYMRAFTQSSLMTLPVEYVPTASPDAELHEWFHARRDQAYAHTDKTSGRDASVKIEAGEGGTIAVELRDEWIPFPRDWIGPAVSLFERQREQFRAEAVTIQAQLEAEENDDDGQ
jgi:hypothetical protein